MRIAVFTDTFFPSTNGIVTSVVAFSKELANRGHHVLIVTPYNRGVEKFSHENIEILPIKGIPAIFYPDFRITFGFTPYLIRKIKDFNPDVIHFHTQFIIGWQAIIMSKMLKKPIIGTFHTYIADESYLKVIGLNMRIFGEVGWKYNNFFYKKIDRVLVPSLNARHELIKHGIRKEMIEIMSNPMPTLDDPSSAGKSLLSDIDTENIVLYIGRLSKEKNVDVSIEAISLVAKAIPDVVFVIVGDGPAKKTLEKLVASLGIQENVRFLGKIPHDELMDSDVFERSAFFLSASPSENQPMTVIEAMHFGLPIVGVNEKGVGELIENNGYKAKNENFGELAIYILKLLKDKELQRRFGSKSKENSVRFDLKTLTDQLEGIYSNTITGSGTRKYPS